MMPLIACFDIGGTAIKYGVAESSGRLLEMENAANPVSQAGSGRMISVIIGRINELKTRYDLRGVAVATAGMVDAAAGVINYASDQTFPGYTGTRLRDILKEKTGLPCEVENDVNCAALGEWWLGAGQGASPFVCLTVGTGIGGAVILDGKLVHGINGCAGEAGLMLIDGQPFEQLASTSQLVRDAAEVLELRPEDVDGELIFALAAAGNEKVKALIKRQVRWWAAGINNICCLLNPELVVLGGGVMAQKAYLRPLLDEALRETLLPVMREKLRVEFARLGNQAGMLGALYNFKQKNNLREEQGWKSE